MKAIRRTSQFKRDTKRLQRQGKDMLKLKAVLESLVAGDKLPAGYRDHALVGQYKGTRECHIEPDWVLVYELAETEIILIRSGSHSDLFR